MIVMGGMQISKSFGVNEVLKDITFSLHQGDRIGVVGVNGCGKSTLFRILMGLEEPDTGGVAVGKGLRVGYLPQILSQDEFSEGLSLREEVLSGRKDLIELEASMRVLENLMGTADGPGLDNLIEEYGRMMHAFDTGGGHELQARTDSILLGLGIAEEAWQRPVDALSGGERTMTGLGRLLLQEPDILLLDEPTNHLDVRAVEWLENYLSKYKGSVMAISHDRYFLDRVATRIVEIENHAATEFQGNYSSFSQEKRMRLLEQQHNFEDQQKEIARLTESMNRLYAWAHQVLSRGLKLKADNIKRRIDRLDKIEKPNLNPASIGIDFKPAKRSGNVAAVCEGVSYAPVPDRMPPLFRNVRLDIRYGQHIALIGPNGCGKSTLLRLLVDEISPDSGTIRLGSGVILGYYDQRHRSLNLDRTSIEEIIDVKRMTNQAARSHLARFGLTGDDVFKRVRDLSGGQRSRVQLAKLMLTGANLLLLDEPTNHLDPKTVETLEDALDAYEGTILFVSHDRYFVNALADKVLDLSAHGIREYMGNYDSYLETRAQEEKEAKDKKEAKRSGEGKRVYQSEAATGKAGTVNRHVPGSIPWIGRPASVIEDDISSVEESMARLAAELASVQAPGQWTLWESKDREYRELQAKLDALMDEWERSAEG